MEDRFFTLEKLERRMRELEQFRFTEMKELSPMDAMDDQTPADEVHRTIPETIQGFRLNRGDIFKGRDRYLWIRKTVPVPPRREGLEAAGLFDFGTTGGGNNSGFESLLYVDGHPYQGVDSNHQEVLLQKFAGQTVELTFLLWSGLEGGGPHREQEHRVRCAQVGYLHTATDDFYYDAKAIVKTVKLLPEESTERYELTAALDSAFLLINWDEDKFYATVGDALDCLNAKLDAMRKDSKITVSCVGHTHIDVAWLWRLKHTREKAMRSFSTVLNLMDEFDEYVFLQTQPQLYSFLKQDCPELYEKIKRKVAQGKWEPDGGMWLEADCNISSGEALVRQFLHGIRFFEKEFGRTCSYLWLPDVFGYSWALPQIMKQCGIKTFMTTKISWNEYNSIPDDLFRWRGMDGSEILTYFVDTPEVGLPLDSRFSTYNGMISPRSVLGSWKKFRNKDLSPETLISYGFGDGGGGVNRNMLKMRRAMDRLPGLPNVKVTKAGDFFERLHRRVEHTDRYVHTWDGELYLEFHRGTYTTQARNKKWNRLMEYKLAETEWLSSLSMLEGGTYDAPALHGAWETVLRNQFHDIIPGSSIHEVYEDSRKEYQQASDQIDAVRKTALDRLTRPQDGAVTLYHSGSFARTDCVFLPVKEDVSFFTEDGSAVPSQQTRDGYYVQADMEPLSVKTLLFRPGKADTGESPFKINLPGRRMETPFYTVEWNEQGQLCRIFDRENRRDALAENGVGNAFEIFEDKPTNYDAWNIDIFYTQKKEYAALTEPPKILECGPLKAAVRFRYRYNRSEITQDLIVYRGSRRIDFETRVDWHESHRLLKTAFETAVRSTKATYEIQFGHVERPTHFNTSWDLARFEVVGHKWADLSEENYGVSLLNNCKYGYSAKDSVLKLSLLRSSKEPDTEADMGMHEFTYSLLPHAGSVTQGNTIQEAAALNLPVHFAGGASALSGRRLIRTDSNAVCVDAVKKAEDEDCVVVRLHECRGGTRELSLSSDYPVVRFEECNLLEKSTGAAVPGNVLHTTLKPFELKTYKLFFE